MSSTAAAATQAPQGFTGYQKLVVGVLAFLQFTIVLDFMILAPLGVVVMPALHINTSQFGLVVSMYAFSAAISGVIAAGFADRFDRKKLLMIFYAGFLLGTLLCAVASSYEMLLIARIVTGLFAGVVGSASLAIVTDLFPIQMRGRVMGVIQTAFGVSTVMGVPIALFLSNHWTWNTPFLMVVGVGAVVGGVIQARMRPVDEHLKHHPDRNPVHHLLQTVTNPYYIQGFATTCLLSVGGFMLMPFMSVFMVHNVGIGLDHLPLVYMVMGSFAIPAGPLIGRAADSFGKLAVFAFGCILTSIMVVIYTHLHHTPLWVVCVIMVLLQISIFSRMISSQALITGLPQPSDRGAYMSVSSSLQQVAGGLAAVISGLVAKQLPTGVLVNYDILGYVLVGTTSLTLVMMYFINQKISATQKAATPEVVPA